MATYSTGYCSGCGETVETVQIADEALSAEWCLACGYGVGENGPLGDMEHGERMPGSKGHRQRIQAMRKRLRRRGIEPRVPGNEYPDYTDKPIIFFGSDEPPQATNTERR